MIMKKMYYFLTMLLLACILMVGCKPNTQTQIAELETQIADLEAQNEDNLLFINSWQSKYNDAKDMYGSTMSMNEPEQRHLDYAKEKMDEATKEINALQREINLNNLSIDLYQKEIDNLKK